jgi:hypothetical protein
MPKLLSVSADAKTIKGKKYGYLTGILYLAPSDISGFNVCAMATPGCKTGCLFTAGRAQYLPTINKARIRKTHELFADRQSFLNRLRKDIMAIVRKAKRERLTPCIRINGTSDLPWIPLTLSKEFLDVQFYDYTKLSKPYTRTRSNYHLTFSHSETNLADCLDSLQHGVNVAVVFDTKKGRPLPETWHGYKVIDGDLSDLRFTDRQGVVIGLRAKGKARKDCSGFVESEKLVSIGDVRSIGDSRYLVSAGKF